MHLEHLLIRLTLAVGGIDPLFGVGLLRCQALTRDPRRPAFT
jgi:hypothetical protein